MMYLWNNIALIEDDGWFTPWVKEAGRLDHHQGFLETLRPYLHGTVLDIGANIGTHTIYYTRYAHTLLAFEPNPDAFECLSHNLQGKAILYHAAVGESPGFIDMVETGKNYGAMYTQPGTQIPVITIDDLKLNACNFIKIDVEGDELAVLHGAKETIQKHKPVMCIECNEHTLARKGLSGADLVSLLATLGYTHQVYQCADACCDLLCLPAAPGSGGA